MRLLIQRVSYSNILIDNLEKKEMNRGLLVYIGISKEDIKIEDKIIEKAVNKLLKLRFFENEEGKLKRNISDINGDIMIVSNFSLYAKADKGTTLSFDNSADYKLAEIIYEKFITKLKDEYNNVFTGKFRSDMKITSESDGPVNVILDF